MKVYVPKNYKSNLDIMETEIAIKLIKDFFQNELSKELKLTRISAPLFVEKSTGVNDNLNGSERPVAFETLEEPDRKIEIIHSLAKWKRIALKRYSVETGNGIYADMNAIRRDEKLDNIHSIYVDQWDWERVITREDRNIEFLKEIVNKIYNVFLKTDKMIAEKYQEFTPFLPEKITFITSQELEDMYPTKNAKEREYEIAKKYGAVFIMQIGDILNGGEKHDGRAPDYDDWKLNGDIIVWNKVLESQFELSSMGIRVDETSLREQLKKANKLDIENLEYHQMLLNNELPLTIGGGIGQSRICMLFLRKAHIGEVQASIWDAKTEKECLENGINLL